MGEIWINLARDGGILVKSWDHVSETLWLNERQENLLISWFTISFSKVIFALNLFINRIFFLKKNKQSGIFSLTAGTRFYTFVDTRYFFCLYSYFCT